MNEVENGIQKNKQTMNWGSAYNVTHGTTARFSTNFEFSRRIFYGEESLEA